MKTTTIATLARSVQTAAVKRAPEILTGIGIAGMITTTVLAVRDTPKALMLLEEAKIEKGEDLTVKEKAKACWKCYIPAVVTGTLSAACLLSANTVNAKRNAALAAAYTLSDSALREYKDAIVETIGEKKAEEVKDKVAEKKIEKNPVSTKEVIITERGNTLCYDAISGRYFKSDMDQIKKAENVLNKRLRNEMCLSLNELYDELGLAHTTIGNSLGWNIDRGDLEFDFSSQIAEDGTPCLVVDYNFEPQYNFFKM